MAYNSYKEALEASPEALAAITAVSIKVKDPNTGKITIKEGISDAELQWRIGQPAINQELINEINPFDGVIFNITRDLGISEVALIVDPDLPHSIPLYSKYDEYEEDRVPMWEIYHLLQLDERSPLGIGMRFDHNRPFNEVSKFVVNGIDETSSVVRGTEEDVYSSYWMFGSRPKSGDVYDLTIESTYIDPDPTKDTLDITNIEWRWFDDEQFKMKVDDGEWTVYNADDEDWDDMLLKYDHSDNPRTINIEFTCTSGLLYDAFLNGESITFEYAPTGTDNQYKYTLSFEMTGDCVLRLELAGSGISWQFEEPTCKDFEYKIGDGEWISSSGASVDSDPYKDLMIRFKNGDPKWVANGVSLYNGHIEPTDLKFVPTNVEHTAEEYTYLYTFNLGKLHNRYNWDINESINTNLPNLLSLQNFGYDMHKSIKVGEGEWIDLSDYNYYWIQEEGQQDVTLKFNIKKTNDDPDAGETSTDPTFNIISLMVDGESIEYTIEGDEAICHFQTKGNTGSNIELRGYYIANCHVLYDSSQCDVNYTAEVNIFGEEYIDMSGSLSVEYNELPYGDGVDIEFTVIPKEGYKFYKYTDAWGNDYSNNPFDCSGDEYTNLGIYCKPLMNSNGIRLYGFEYPISDPEIKIGDDEWINIEDVAYGRGDSESWYEIPSKEGPQDIKMRFSVDREDNDYSYKIYSLTNNDQSMAYNEENKTITFQFQTDGVQVYDIVMIGYETHNASIIWNSDQCDIEYVGGELINPKTKEYLGNISGMLDVNDLFLPEDITLTVIPKDGYEFHYAHSEGNDNIYNSPFDYWNYSSSPLTIYCKVPLTTNGIKLYGFDKTPNTPNIKIGDDEWVDITNYRTAKGYEIPSKEGPQDIKIRFSVDRGDENESFEVYSITNNGQPMTYKKEDDIVTFQFQTDGVQIYNIYIVGYNTKNASVTWSDTQCDVAYEGPYRLDGFEEYEPALYDPITQEPILITGELGTDNKWLPEGNNVFTTTPKEGYDFDKYYFVYDMWYDDGSEEWITDYDYDYSNPSSPISTEYPLTIYCKPTE